jgi:small subunit ribosomal protein S5
VAKVVKGGRRFSFSALVVVGDGKGSVGFGVGKAAEVPDAIRKASEQAKKGMLKIHQNEGTIPFDVRGHYGSAKILMSPAKKGKGIIAGGGVRVMCELAGIQDIVCKVHGTKNAQNVVRAAADGFRQLLTIDEYAALRGKSVADVYQKRETPKKEKGMKKGVNA